jgi:hypothetical protein
MPDVIASLIMAKMLSSLHGDAWLRRRSSIQNSVRSFTSSDVSASIRWPSVPKLLTGVSMADQSMTGTYQLNLPKELLSEAKRQPKPKPEQLRVDGFRNSWLSRLSEMFVGKD